MGPARQRLPQRVPDARPNIGLGHRYGDMAVFEAQAQYAVRYSAAHGVTQLEPTAAAASSPRWSTASAAASGPAVAAPAGFSRPPDATATCGPRPPSVTGLRRCASGPPTTSSPPPLGGLISIDGDAMARRWSWCTDSAAHPPRGAGQAGAARTAYRTDHRTAAGRRGAIRGRSRPDRRAVAGARRWWPGTRWAASRPPPSPSVPTWSSGSCCSTPTTSQSRRRRPRWRRTAAGPPGPDGLAHDAARRDNQSGQRVRPRRHGAGRFVRDLRKARLSAVHPRARLGHAGLPAHVLLRAARPAGRPGSIDDYTALTVTRAADAGRSWEQPAAAAAAILTPGHCTPSE